MPTDEYFKYRVHFDDGSRRILVGDSLTSFEDDDHRRDVVLGGSFAGVPTGVLPLRQGARAWIAHEAGPGKDNAGIAGLETADRFGVPAAAIATMSARIADGDALLTGSVAAVNDAAARLGVAPGMSGERAATLMLQAPEGDYRDVAGLVDESTILLKESSRGRILSCWSSSRVSGKHPRDVFLLASHAGLTMARYVGHIEPRGVICNDAGFALDDSGVEGLAELDRYGIAAAAVAADSARIGDPSSTAEGTISAVNETAARAGVTVGQNARIAADVLLEASDLPA